MAARCKRRWENVEWDEGKRERDGGKKTGVRKGRCEYLRRDKPKSSTREGAIGVVGEGSQE